MEQLKEFEFSLNKMMSGDISLVNHFGSIQLAIQSAIRNTASPEILQMFMKRETGSLRSRLASLDSDFKLGRIQRDAYTSAVGEILKLLDKLNEPLSSTEQELLNKVQFNLFRIDLIQDDENEKLKSLFILYCSTSKIWITSVLQKTI